VAGGNARERFEHGFEQKLAKSAKKSDAPHVSPPGTSVILFFVLALFAPFCSIASYFGDSILATAGPSCW
jgi:hypothetical protein